MLSLHEKNILSKWNLAQLYSNAVTRNLYINYAHFAYHDFFQKTGKRFTPIESAVDLCDFLLIDIDFQKACSAVDPYLDVNNHASTGTLYKLAIVLARYIVDRSWSRII